MAMNQILAKVEEKSLRTETFSFEIGDTVDVHVRIREGDKERIQLFNGIVIARRGGGTREYFTVRRIVEAASPEDIDALIEVGPGLGALTDRLLEVAPHLIAVEMDATLAARLRERHAGATNLTVVEADALTRTPAQLLDAAGFAALLPCAGAALLILAGGGPAASGLNAQLARRLPVALGLMSYSLYLWHWPILVYAE